MGPEGGDGGRDEGEAERGRAGGGPRNIDGLEKFGKCLRDLKR
ncbi:MULTISPECIES: hypothetical protein [unclassified Streptomyces]|nr:MULTISPECIES: hypothetical protein [unclassified Streptomyces]MCX4835540.1 hypothetical protein [Streptomyces sp. NBC_01016]